MIGLGIARALNGELIGGLWFTFIGLFLHQAARASRQLVAIRARLEPLRVAEIMSPLEGSIALASLASWRRNHYPKNSLSNTCAGRWLARAAR